MKKNFLLLTLACLMGIGSAWGKTFSPGFYSCTGSNVAGKGGDNAPQNDVKKMLDGDFTSE